MSSLSYSNCAKEIDGCKNNTVQVWLIIRNIEKTQLIVWHQNEHRITSHNRFQQYHQYHHHQRQRCNVVSCGFFCSDFSPQVPSLMHFPANLITPTTMMMMRMMVNMFVMTMMTMMAALKCCTVYVGLGCKSCLVEVSDSYSDLQP